MIPIINQQKIEKLDHQPSGTVQVHSIFHTIQGEGPYAGHPAIFIRLTGCNLQCPGCDTEYTSVRRTLTPEEVFKEVADVNDYPEAPTPLIVITGGEPFRQNITPLCDYLIQCGYTRIQVETNGTLPPSLGLSDDVHVVCSPKTGKINASMQHRLDSLKYVVRASEICRDGLPTRALGHSATPAVAKPPEGFTGPIYIQPMDEKSAKLNKANIETAVQSVQAHGRILQLQIHKYANLE